MILEETCRTFECLQFAFSSEPDKRAELWKARHNAWYAAQALRPGCKVDERRSNQRVSTRLAVPSLGLQYRCVRSNQCAAGDDRLRQEGTATIESIGVEPTFDSDRYCILPSSPIVGHVGDGNFHVFAIVDPKNPEEIERVHEFSTALAR